MDELELFLNYLQACANLTTQLEKVIKEDKEQIHLALSGELEDLYKKQCDEALEQVKKIRKRIRILYSESSAGL